MSLLPQRSVCVQPRRLVPPPLRTKTHLAPPLQSSALPQRLCVSAVECRHLSTPMQTKTIEDQLRDEIESLQRQLAGHKPVHARRTSSAALIVIALVTIILIVVGFFVGYLPRQR